MSALSLEPAAASIDESQHRPRQFDLSLAHPLAGLTQVAFPSTLGAHHYLSVLNLAEASIRHVLVPPDPVAADSPLSLDRVQQMRQRKVPRRARIALSTCRRSGGLDLYADASLDRTIQSFHGRRGREDLFQVLFAASSQRE